jgi:hypothetical protein
MYGRDLASVRTLLALSLITEIRGQDLYGVNKLSISEIHRRFPELCLRLIIDLLTLRLLKLRPNPNPPTKTQPKEVPYPGPD